MRCWIIGMFFAYERYLAPGVDANRRCQNRDQPMMRPRRDSRLASSLRPTSILSNVFRSNDGQSRNTPRAGRNQQHRDGDSDEEANDRTPLMRATSGHTSNTARYGADSRPSLFASRARQPSVQTVSSGCSPRDNQAHLILPI